MHVTGDIFLLINTFIQNACIAFITCFYFVYIHFLSSFWDHSDFIHLSCYYYIVSDSCNVCFGDQNLDFLSDYLFEMVSSVVNRNGNRVNLIFLDLMFLLRLTVLISVMWLINDAELVLLIALSIILCLMWCLTLSIISFLILLNCKWLWRDLKTTLLWNPHIHSMKITFLNVWWTVKYFQFFVVWYCGRQISQKEHSF